MKLELKLESVNIDYKAKELYNRVVVDNIAPYYFVVIKESKYCNGLEDLKDKYRASIEYQSFAYKTSDYNLHKAQVLNGLVKHFSDYKTATRWLKDKIKENFTMALIPNGERDIK